MKNVISWIILILVVALVIFGYIYLTRPEVPEVAEDGSISGNYTMEGIMRLGEPYICRFEKADDTSRIAGVIHTNGKNMFGEFRIMSNLAEDEFNSFLLTQGGESYTWTSLAPLGYKSGVAKSASRSAYPEDQAQIVGKRDALDYECQPWQNVDDTLFEVPGWINFTEI